jgi:hypothetical protein
MGSNTTFLRCKNNISQVIWLLFLWDITPSTVVHGHDFDMFWSCNHDCPNFTATLLYRQILLYVYKLSPEIISCWHILTCLPMWQFVAQRVSTTVQLYNWIEARGIKLEYIGMYGVLASQSDLAGRGGCIDPQTLRMFSINHIIFLWGT